MTKEFAETLIKEDYNKCLDYLALEHEAAKHVNLDTMKAGLANFRKVVVANFGEELKYTFISAEKKFSTVHEENTPPNTTVVLMQFENQNEFGIMKFIFDDTSKKVLNVNTLELKESIPEMLWFWLFGLLVICVPIFNIYVIRLIWKSALERKALKYLAVICLNVPSILFSAMNGLAVKLLTFQFMLGLSFNYMGYINASWTFGIPIGGIYWLWKLKNKNNDLKEELLEGEIH